MKEVVPLPVLPAKSVALAESVVVPTGKLDAGPLALAQVLLATPESAAAAVHVIETV